MGFWDALNYVGDQAKGIGAFTANHTYAAVTKINQVVINQKLHEYLSDPETRAQIGVFTVTLAKNTGRYVVYEGIKHIPGVNVAQKLISDTAREVKQKKQRDGMKAIEEKVERLEKDTETSAQIVAHKLIFDTEREVRQKNQGDEMKTTEEKVEIWHRLVYSLRQLLKTLENMPYIRALCIFQKIKQMEWKQWERRWKD
ncbi:uncharacterized protein [Rutidosis leptorrhynchoides]|uniref:uncharacterized protein isoform X2 n=1 Tax=Rutidosis leptorrhynchoides TaxID=125765 RepID=UPI003A99286C